MLGRKGVAPTEVRPFIAAVLDVREKNAVRGEAAAADPGSARLWRDFLTAAPGHIHTESFTFEMDFGTGVSVVDIAGTIDRLVGQARARAGDPPG